jgi:glycosyltransferase involved in cell wall biosynthesis
MKILHVTPHLGGGVGRAHAALGGALPKDVQRTFVLLEEPRDRRFADAIEAGGASVIVARNLDHVASLASEAGIVQFEFWNHPRLFECLARCDFPALRTVFWSHVSGLFRPVIQTALIEAAGRFVFTTEASLAIPSIPDAARENVTVINSGFGFADASPHSHGAPPAIAYLGTVDFVKMHPGFFDAVDALSGDLRVSVWGAPSEAVIERANAMRHPERIRFGGQTADPAATLSDAAIFFYPLQRDHYGTAENALIEAMSLGLVPVVLNNPAEKAIVRHGETGFVAQTIEECAALLQTLIVSPELREKLSRAASRYVGETRTPAQSAQAFMALWQALLGEPAQPCDFRRAIGGTPAEWFLATQCLPGETWRAAEHAAPQAASKGVLAHFESVFPDDASLSRLAASGGGGFPMAPEFFARSS